MLALTRRTDESIIIGDPAKPICKITIVAVKGNKVKMSFSADKSIKINREEVAKKITENTKAT